MKLKIKRVLPLIGIALFVYLLFKIGIKNIIDSFVGIKFSFLFLSLVFVPLIVLMQTWKWLAITKKQKIELNFFEAFKIQFISLFYGFVTPARIGTFIKIAYLREKTKNFGKSASSVVIERLFDMIVVLLLAAFGSLILIRNFTKEAFFNIAIWMFSLLLLFIIFSFFLISKNTGRKTMKFLYERLLTHGLKNRTRDSFEGFYDSMPKKRFLLLPFILTVLTWFLIYTPNFFIAKSLNIDIPYFTFVFLFAIATIIAELPITISGLGVREASLIAMLKIFGVEASKVMSLSILSIIITTAIPALIGFFLSLKEHIRKME